MKNDRTQEEFTAMVRRMDGIIARISVLFSDRTADGIRDLYQDIVCALWHSYPRFRHSSAESTWVYRVALNTALLHRRRQRYAPMLVSVDNGRLDTLTAEACDELVERLYELIERLPERYRALAYLYIDGLSLDEMATVLGVPTNTVKQRIKHMKEKMIKLKEDEEQ